MKYICLHTSSAYNSWEYYVELEVLSIEQDICLIVMLTVITYENFGFTFFTAIVDR